MRRLLLVVAVLIAVSACGGEQTGAGAVLTTPRQIPETPSELPSADSTDSAVPGEVPNYTHAPPSPADQHRLGLLLISVGEAAEVGYRPVGQADPLPRSWDEKFSLTPICGTRQPSDDRSPAAMELLLASAKGPRGGMLQAIARYEGISGAEVVQADRKELTCAPYRVGKRQAVRVRELSLPPQAGIDAELAYCATYDTPAIEDCFALLAKGDVVTRLLASGIGLAGEETEQRLRTVVPAAVHGLVSG